MLAASTFAVKFPISIIIKKIADFLIRKITLYFFLKFNSSISVCVREKTEDSESENKEEKIKKIIKRKINKGMFILI